MQTEIHATIAQVNNTKVWGMRVKLRDIKWETKTAAVRREPDQKVKVDNVLSSISTASKKH